MNVFFSYLLTKRKVWYLYVAFFFFFLYRWLYSSKLYMTFIQKTFLMNIEEHCFSCIKLFFMQFISSNFWNYSYNIVITCSIQNVNSVHLLVNEKLLIRQNMVLVMIILWAHKIITITSKTLTFLCIYSFMRSCWSDKIWFKLKNY